MTIKEIYDECTNKFISLYLHQRAVKKLADEELQKLKICAASIKYKSEQSDLSASCHGISFYSACGKIVPLTQKVISIEDRMDLVYRHKNKQYQWLLVDAYEIYKLFLQKIYKYIHSVDNSFPEIKHENDILQKLRNYLPKYKEKEIKNELGMNIRLMLVLIKELRNIIVHRNGVVNDKEQFIEKIIKKESSYNNDKHCKNIFDFLSDFFGINECCNTISLLEIRLIPDLPISIENSRLEIIFQTLLASIYEICEETSIKTQSR
jgi:hypothetical protein